MSKVIELRNKRNTLWEQTKAFLEEHRDENGLVEASAVEQYEKMASDVKALGDEIRRLEDQMEMDAKLSAATSAPVHQDPKAGQRDVILRPTATAKYSEAFWNMMRGNSSLEVRDALSVGVDQNGGYTVPDEFERQLIQALEENNVFRKLAKTIRTNSGTRTIPIAMDNGSASWIEEGAAIQESDMSFTQETLSAYISWAAWSRSPTSCCMIPRSTSRPISHSASVCVSVTRRRMPSSTALVCLRIRRSHLLSRPVS